MAATASKRLRGCAIVVCFVLLGVAIGGSGAHAYCSRVADLPSGRQEWTFVLSSDPKRSEFGMSASADAVSPEHGRFRVTVYFDDDTDLLSGARFVATCALSPLKEGARAFSYGAGIVATAAVGSYAQCEPGPLFGPIYGLRSRAIALMVEHAGESAGVMQALVCGYRSAIQGSGEYEAFKSCGLAHLVAVSGAHLAIVAMAFGCVLRLLRIPRRGATCMSAAFVLAYLAFAGVPISAVRAAVMAMLSMGSGMAARRSASLNAIALCVIGFLALDPTAAVSVSLFLSAASTLGIVLFAPLVSSWLLPLPRAVSACAGEPLGLTLSANLATLPFSVAMFKQLPLVAPLANVAAAPLFTLGCVGGLASTIVACASAPAAPVAIAVGGCLVLPLRAVVSALSGIPYACVALTAPLAPMIALSACALGALWLAWPPLTRRLVACSGGAALLALATFVTLAALPHADELAMLDVGQGDAILLRSGHASVLVDTGNSDARLREELARQGVFRLDAVIVTHPDDDHCASLASLFGCVRVERFLCAADLLECPCAKCTGLLRVAREGVGDGGVCGLERGDVVSVGSMAMEVLWPGDFSDQGGNRDSLCLMVSVDPDGDGASDWRALLTGDAEGAELSSMAARGDLCDVDVLKVGHHGSKLSLDAEVAALLRPEVALISVGASNRYGHPSDEALATLADVGASVFRTDEQGTVVVSFAKDAIRVQ